MVIIFRDVVNIPSGDFIHHNIECLIGFNCKLLLSVVLEMRRGGGRGGA